MLTVVTLVVLFGGMASLSPHLREQTTVLISEPGWTSLRAMTTLAVTSGFSFVGDYADYHVYLFSFLVAACLFAVLMIRVLS